MFRELESSSDKMYRLEVDEKGRYVFSVLCGGIAMYDVSFCLSESEVAQYEVDGIGYLDALSLMVARNPELYEAR